MSAPTFSVITPTWNRASFLESVWTGLNEQTCNDFEWIVGDDGSSDDTERVVRDLAKRSAFPILYIRAAAHVGKARMDNEAISRATGELALWCDSDDVLLPRAIERLCAAWRSMPAAEHSRFAGLTAWAATDEGPLIASLKEAGLKDVSWNDLVTVHRVSGDMVYAARIDLLRATPFPEVDLVIPESAVWTQIGDQPSRVVPEVLKKVQYRSPHAISFSGLMNYNRGRAHAAAITHRALNRLPCSYLVKTRRLVNFIRYCIHGEINLTEARALWRENTTSVAFWVAVPAAVGLALVDMLRNKVARSHREFLANRHSTVSAVWLSKRAQSDAR